MPLSLPLLPQCWFLPDPVKDFPFPNPQAVIESKLAPLLQWKLHKEDSLIASFFYFRPIKVFSPPFLKDRDTGFPPEPYPSIHFSLKFPL